MLRKFVTFDGDMREIQIPKTATFEGLRDMMMEEFEIPEEQKGKIVIKCNGTDLCDKDLSLTDFGMTSNT